MPTWAHMSTSIGIVFCESPTAFDWFGLVPSSCTEVNETSNEVKGRLVVPTVLHALTSRHCPGVRPVGDGLDGPITLPSPSAAIEGSGAP